MASVTMRSEERFSRNAETEIYTLSLHDALPIWVQSSTSKAEPRVGRRTELPTKSGNPKVLIDGFRHDEIGRAVQQECRDRDLHSFPTRRSSDLGKVFDVKSGAEGRAADGTSYKEW